MFPGHTSFIFVDALFRVAVSDFRRARRCTRRSRRLASIAFFIVVTIIASWLPPVDMPRWLKNARRLAPFVLGGAQQLLIFMLRHYYRLLLATTAFFITYSSLASFINVSSCVTGS